MEDNDTQTLNDKKVNEMANLNKIDFLLNRKILIKLSRFVKFFSRSVKIFSRNVKKILLKS